MSRLRDNSSDTFHSFTQTLKFMSPAVERLCEQAQADAQEARAREAAFQAALQEVTLFKSRTSAALLQAQERADAAQVSAAGLCWASKSGEASWEPHG